MLNYAVSIGLNGFSYLDRHFTDMCKMRNKVSVGIEEQDMPVRKVLQLPFFRCDCDEKRVLHNAVSCALIYLLQNVNTLKKKFFKNVCIQKKII